MTLARSIRSAATNHYQMSLAVLYENAPKIFADDRLTGINPAGYETLEQYVTFILLNGSPVQRSALLDNLDTLSDIAMPEIKYLSRAPGTALLETYIRQTCQVMGCDFKGDLATVVSGLYDDYGGITIIEWARFFQGITQGKFKDEYQSVNTRGLNAEFLRDWLDQFYERRDKIIASLRKDMQAAPVAEPQNAPTIEQIRQFQRDAVAIDGQVHNWRTEYEFKLTTRRIERIRDERKGDDGKTVVYEYDVPIIEDTERAAYTRLYDFIAVFYGFTGASTKEAIRDLTTIWEFERITLDIEVEVAKFYRSRSKSLLLQLKKFVVENHRGLLTAGLRKIAEVNPSTTAFVKALTGRDYEGDKPNTSIEPHLQEVATKLIREFHDQYGDYVREAIAKDSFVLYRDEYTALRCIHHAVTTGGIEHPFTKIFNIEQQLKEKSIQTQR